MATRLLVQGASRTLIDQCSIGFGDFLLNVLLARTLRCLVRPPKFAQVARLVRHTCFVRDGSASKLEDASLPTTVVDLISS
jgi:hypothetical protein